MTEFDRDPRPEAACGRVRGRIEAFLDGSLPPLETARDAGHLEACVECAAHEAAARSAREALVALLGAPVDREWLHSGLAGRLDAAAAPARPRLVRVIGPPGDRAGAPVLAAAAAILLFFGFASTGLFDEVVAGLGTRVAPIEGFEFDGFELDLPRTLFDEFSAPELPR